MITQLIRTSPDDNWKAESEVSGPLNWRIGETSVWSSQFDNSGHYLNVNLRLLNLLPVPVLDGGDTILLLEAVRVSLGTGG